MDEVLQPAGIISSSGRRESLDPLAEHERWHMRVKQLLIEADYAKSRGQWKKAQDLLFEVSQITRKYYTKRF